MIVAPSALMYKNLQSYNLGQKDLRKIKRMKIFHISGLFSFFAPTPPPLPPINVGHFERGILNIDLGRGGYLK